MHSDYRTALVTLTLLGAIAVHGAEASGGLAPPETLLERTATNEALIQKGLQHEAAEDFSSALVCFRTAAKKGSPEGAFRSASYLLSGRISAKHGESPVPEDLPDAIKLLESSAAAGHPEAMRVLGACHATGRGVSQDKIEACKWWRLAGERGDEASKSYLEHLQGQLNDADRTAALDRANKFAQSHSAVEPVPNRSDLVRLKLNGISGTAFRRVALINNQSFFAGEQKRLPLANGTNLLVRCVEIRSSEVVIQEGDSPAVVTLTFGKP